MAGVTMRALRTARLRLEPQVAAHADAMFEVLSDPAIYEYENAPPQSVEGLRERYRKLESRRSGDGHEQWLNWVLRLDSGEIAGYVQATVHDDGRASIAYELGSRFWGQGIASEAVGAMIAELAATHGARRVTAVFKRANRRSRRLLTRLDFVPADPRDLGIEIEADERVMARAAG
jgi:RimJ/RimL family protein N-acetyltransferase